MNADVISRGAAATPLRPERPCCLVEPPRAAATAPRELPGRRRLLGVALGWYVLKVPPLAELEIDEVARSIGPTIDRYVSGEVRWGDEGPVPSPQ